MDKKQHQISDLPSSDDCLNKGCQLGDIANIVHLPDKAGRVCI